MKSFKTLVAVLALLCSYNVWAYDFEADGIYYNSNDDLTCEVTYATSSYNSYSGEVVIPATVKNGEQEYTVISIGYRAFRNCSNLTAVSIPNGVTSLDKYAFSGCI